MPTINADENHSHLACSTWNTPGQKFLEKKLDFLKFFGAGAPVVSQRLYSGGLHLDSREFTPKGVVFYEKSARARQ